MTRKMISRLGSGLLCLLCAGGVGADPILTAAGTTAGFTLSKFADNFPVGNGVGPLGIAFVGGGQVMVSDYPGNVRIFPTDTDGQHANTIPVVQNYGFSNAVGLAKLGNFVYMTQQGAGNVVRLNLNGTFNSPVVGGIPFATGIFATNGKLYVSDCCSGTGIYAVDPVANTKVVFKTGSFDGISSDGTILYAEIGGHIRGYRLSDGVEVFDSGFINGADGTELGAGTLDGKIFVNTNFGELWEVDLANPSDKTLLVTGGTRGDFVTADPNGTLLFTQTADIWRLAPAAGGCIGTACNNVPEPGSMLLMLLGLFGFAGMRGRAAAKRVL